VWVEAAVPERDLASIGAARAAEIAIPGSPGSLTGKLVTIGNLVDPQNRTVQVIFDVVNRAGVLKIEMFVEARIPTGPRSTALMIPASAVLVEAGSSYVFLESEPGVYVRRVVTLGDRKDGAIVVTSGLTKGDKVVTVGTGVLRSASLKSEIPVDEDDKANKGEKAR
jgi:cobalt-zinc-cadmium efflux system membrane fusion protein